MARRALLSCLMLLASAAHAVTAQSYIVTDQEGKVLIEHNADDVRPIASI